MTLENLRREITDIDREIMKLFEKRMNIAKEIAKIKKQIGLDILDKDRELQVIENNLSLIVEEYKKEAEILTKTIMELSKNVQSKI